MIFSKDFNYEKLLLNLSPKVEELIPPLLRYLFHNVGLRDLNQPLKLTAVFWHFFSMVIEIKCNKINYAPL